ncbi:acetyl-CoA carboxylase biotin carboxylase subunit [Fluoribacter dumoffii]|uniref:Biotin carboxylase n=1 Tax=Fluoribacter dumoffii TaxID=463 RepID=A0A377G8H4_9GAMM|nr:acetyl-CoA carboxylase biotin carboxylase subunit [Fluoribacter dumoffii]KTC89926.1 acyl CoA carboxylase subunit alpha [Fluoribacter dumoffii NY 23]MCW8418278.1 acetyl-CoA carboxylase biotin carboxylase subunit [Fluoribacter dumoffii]MCW8453880.1 acetyl-CoA carboxylase biotin carboxylase subunit [Fluoribacter dumoffii]MCW8462049.1 acetyl-CoA carboxylase biotin carboxylase subunit [Fluoribacter dumoffii]MCW8482261.1 acetyl-CoA carboxylase biotin carboxylase subunit [Fluoribacter dumoffii]
MFNKILVANRGEIACRIIKTARSMGIHTVAIYSSVDKDSLHVRSADSAYCVGEAPAKESYLNIASIIHIAKECGAQAIHPGYGFLSENPEFAKACNEAGIIFIGPSVEAMEAMASKQLAKQLLEKTNVPLTPGYHGSEQTEDRLLAEAKKIGFPVLIKAANGGGGKGMRAVYQESEFSAALAGAKRESMASFADDTVILEKLVLNPRHVELQIMADNHGNVVHLFERDCSIQRRHQKIIEEAPAPNLPASLRQKLAEAGCEVARSIKYSGAGTVEFLVDGSEHFYFMEMNTRLQVEHPVTEMITGLDLVSWQLKIAADEPLPMSQDEIKAHGHAIECRIYAEDPHHDFIPSIGQIHFLEEPSGDGIRIDTGVQVSSQITMYYDPMIAKLIAWGANREEALFKLEHALSHYFIGGLKTNIPFLQTICHHPKFRKAELSTDFLSNEKINLPVADKQMGLLMAVSVDYLKNTNAIQDPLLQEAFAWQSQISSHWIWRYKDKEDVIEAFITPINKNQFKVRINNQEHLISGHLHSNQLRIETNKQTYHATIEKKKQFLTLYTNQWQITIERFDWGTIGAQATTHKGQLTAPMPATVVAVLKNIGEKVKAGERLIVLEAMKMEHTIHAPADGILLEIFYAVGAQVNEGEELLSLSEEDS